MRSANWHKYSKIIQGKLKETEANKYQPLQP